MTSFGNLDLLSALGRFIPSEGLRMNIPPVNIGGDFGKATGKFFHEISRLVRWIGEPSHIRRVGKAEAENRILQAKADAQILEITTRAQIDNARLVAAEKPQFEQIIVSEDVAIQNDVKLLVARAVANKIEDLVREQINLENVIAIAADVLEYEPDENVSDDTVDEDWLTRVFGKARQVSNEDMQELWGRVLAGEVIQPGSFSLRTLDVLANLSQVEAQIFSKVPRFALDSRGVLFLALYLS